MLQFAEMNLFTNLLLPVALYRVKIFFEFLDDKLISLFIDGAHMALDFYPMPVKQIHDITMGDIQFLGDMNYATSRVC